MAYARNLLDGFRALPYKVTVCERSALRHDARMWWMTGGVARQRAMGTRRAAAARGPRRDFKNGMQVRLSYLFRRR
jgi:hypothetical protein